MAVNTMSAIKKKMETMKTAAGDAVDKAEHFEQKLGEQMVIYETVRK